MPFSPGKYRKVPVVIEAFYLDPEDPDTWRDAAKWCGGTLLRLRSGDRAIEIQTLEGTMYADVGDYIIKGVKGEFYPCKPDIFAATYQREEG